MKQQHDHFQNSAKFGWKRLLLFFLVLLFLLLVTISLIWWKRPDLFPGYFNPFTDQRRILEQYQSPSLKVVDQKRGVALLEKEPDLPLPPASLAKLFSVAFVSEKQDLKTPVPVRREALAKVKKHSSLAHLKAGEVLSLHDIFAAMLIPSGNDAAYVLADYYGGLLAPQAKSYQERQAAYLKGLHRYMQKQGWKHTKLYDPSGYDYQATTTANDLYGVTRILLQKDWFRELMTQVTYKARLIKGQEKTWLTTNPFMNPKEVVYRPEVQGIKTGSLDGQNHLILHYVKGDQDYLFLSLGARSKAARIQNMEILLRLLAQETH